jgi:flagellar biogenesis protein FliO
MVAALIVFGVVAFIAADTYVFVRLMRKRRAAGS